MLVQGASNDPSSSLLVSDLPEVLSTGAGGKEAVQEAQVGVELAGVSRRDDEKENATATVQREKKKVRVKEHQILSTGYNR